MVRLVVGFVEVLGAHVYDAKCGGYTSNKEEEKSSESCHFNNAKCIKYPADSHGRTIKARRHLRHQPTAPSSREFGGIPFPHKMGTPIVLTAGTLTSSTSRLPAGRQVKLTWQAPTRPSASSSPFTEAGVQLPPPFSLDRLLDRKPFGLTLPSNFSSIIIDQHNQLYAQTSQSNPLAYPLAFFWF